MRNPIFPRKVSPACRLVLAVALASVGVIPAALAEPHGLAALLAGHTPLLRSSQGYLGVELADLDSDRAQALKLKSTHGALVTLIDHDAPAGQIGLRAGDVILQFNGKNIDGAEQLRRLLRATPAGRKSTLLVSRDGNQQSYTVVMADRRAMEHAVWKRLGTGGDPGSPEMGFLSAPADVPKGSDFHLPFFGGSSLKVGALVEPLSSQMAEYLGVEGGVVIRQVARRSEAAVAGLRAFDVILKVSGDPIHTQADWERALRANQGRSVVVTVLRDRHPVSIVLQVDSHHHGALRPVALSLRPTLA